MALLSHDLLSLEVKEQKIGRALKFKSTGGFGARRSLCFCADPRRTAAALATMNGDSKRCETMEDKNDENLQCALACALIKEHKKDNKGGE